MREPVLLVLAAGMGSRYGGLKQIDPVGPNGEIIIDYSLYDAAKAGFKKAVFVIKEENLEDFEEILLPKASSYIDIEFVFQDINCVPNGCVVPKDRVKPWGTGHAVLAARDKINSPFAVINADDFYGREAFEKIYDFLKNAEDKEYCDYAMVGFLLKNTVTENGYVSRGICVTEDGKLDNVVERTQIELRDNGDIEFSEDEGKTWVQLDRESIVSMNMWGFTPSLFDALEKGLIKLFADTVPSNPLKSELFLPFVVNDMLEENKAMVEVLSSKDKWYGVTYKEDKEMVNNALKELANKGEYPTPLWK